MSASINDLVSSVMEQVQVFASTWSLVGGKFDDGNMLADAEDAKRHVESAVRATVISSAEIFAANLLREIAGTDWSKKELCELADDVQSGRRKIHLDPDF